MSALTMSLLASVGSTAASTRFQTSPDGGAKNNPAREETPGAQLEEARKLLESGRGTDAEREVRGYLASHPDSADGHFLLGHILFHEIQEEAKQESRPGGVETLGPENASRTEHNQDRAKSSLGEFTVGAKLRAPSAADLKVVAFDYVLLGDYADADKWLTRMLTWTPTDVDGWYYLGRAKYTQNRFAEAIDAFEHALKLDPANAKIEDNLGLAYAGLNRTEEAVAAYKTAIEWQARTSSPSQAPFIDIADLLLDQNRPAEAVSYLQRAIEIAPYDSKAHELLGKAYIRLEDLPKAQTELERALESAPQSKNIPCMLAPLYRKQGQAEKAKTESARCAALAGSSSIAETPRP